MTFGIVELRGGGARVALAPALGGRIVALELAGRQWLWINPDLPFRDPATEGTGSGGASYAEIGNSGGYDECFPTVAACVLPSGTPRFGGLALPDHGELWRTRPAVTFEQDDAGQRATCTWTGQRMPYTFVRTVQVTTLGEVRMLYAVENRGTDPLPFVWSSQPLLPLTDRTQLDLPTGALVRVADSQGTPMRGITPEFRWPTVRLASRIADLTCPAANGRRYTFKGFVDVPTGRVVVGVTEGDLRLDVRIDGREVPNLAIGINNGMAPATAPNRPQQTLAFAPCIGGPDSLTAALNAWRKAHWIAPAQRQTWSVTWSARKLAPEGAAAVVTAPRPL